MIDIFKQIAAQLNSKSDWAIVGGAALGGAAIDLFLVNIGVLSAGECAAGSAGLALTTKRGWEARRDAKQNQQLLKLYLDRAKMIVNELSSRGENCAAELLTLELAIEVAEIDRDLETLKVAIAAAIARL